MITAVSRYFQQYFLLFYVEVSFFGIPGEITEVVFSAHIVAHFSIASVCQGDTNCSTEGKLHDFNAFP